MVLELDDKGRMRLSMKALVPQQEASAPVAQ
jgi:predicted RNA-binding protein with RPS1 domain